MQSSASSGLSSNKRILIVSVCAEVGAAILERFSYDISLRNAGWAVCRERYPNFLEPNTRIASSRSREGWRSLDFTAKLWKDPAGCSLLLPAPDRCLPERRARNKPRAGRREAEATGNPHAQKQNGGPPQLTTTDCAASSTKSRILVRNARNAYMASPISDSSSM